MKYGRVAALIAVIGLIGLGLGRLHAQGTPAAPNLLQALRWRNIGPDRGGRVTSVAGLVNDRMTYYMGATGGGVWKTTDAGINWTNISDRYFRLGGLDCGERVGSQHGLCGDGRGVFAVEYFTWRWDV